LVFVKLQKPHAVILFKDSFSIEKCILVSCILSIGNDSPLSGANNTEAHLGLKTWLVEAREHPEAMEGFKLRIEVLLTI
jgi:hypothetical protein